MYVPIYYFESFDRSYVVVLCAQCIYLRMGTAMPALIKSYNTSWKKQIGMTRLVAMRRLQILDWNGNLIKYRRLLRFGTT